MRGKHTNMKRSKEELRITPAGAGKTADYNIAGVKTQDHPRRCGENTKKIL